MARTEAGAELTQAHRQIQLGVRAAALRDVMRLWAAVVPTDLAGTIGTFAAAAAVVILARNRQSAEAAVTYFEQFRRAERVGGSSGADIAAPLPEETVTGVVRGAGLAGIVNARRRGFPAEAAARNGLARVSGSVSSLVLSGARDTIMASTAADDRSMDRWQRVTSGSPCASCTSIAAQGPVFSARAGRFEPHDNCACQAEPAYAGTRLPAASQRLKDTIEAAGVNPTDVQAVRHVLGV